MTQQEKNQRMCERAGWVKFFEPGDEEGTGRWVWHKGNKNVRRLPNLFESLDAVHEVEMHLGNSANPTAALWWQYIETLTKICGNVPAIFATAAQRAEALYQTLFGKEGE